MDLLPAGAAARHRLLPLAVPLDAAQLSGLAALWLPDGGVPPELKLYALGPAAWQGRRTAFSADGAYRMVAVRAVETLLGLTGAGPLPPSAVDLRRRMLRDFVGGRTVLVAGGGKVGRAIHTLLRSAHVRSRLMTTHPANIPMTAPWSALPSILPVSAAVVWVSERPLVGWLDVLPQTSPIVVVPELEDRELDELHDLAPDRAGIAVTLYRPRELARQGALVVLSDSPRRQSSAMAQFLRHLQRPR